MRRVNIFFLLSSVFLMTDGYPGPCPCFAGMHALVPGVLKSGVTIITSAAFEPGTTATTTTRFARFRDDAAFGAYGTDGRRRSYWWFYVSIGHTQKEGHCYYSHMS